MSGDNRESVITGYGAMRDTCSNSDVKIKMIQNTNIRFKVVLGSLFCEKRTGDCVVTKTASVNGVLMSLNSICRAT